jgi:hypothetical protein
MYGSPCQMAAGGPEPCCGDVAKRGLGKDCYGCTTHYSYSMCVNGEFTCACTCEVPEGFMVIIRGDDAGCADGGQEGGGLEDVRAPLDAGDEGAADAREDGPSDAAGPTEDAGDAD